MKILINTSLLRFGGAVQVAISFIHECRAFREHEFHVVLGPGVEPNLNLNDFPDNFHFKKISFGEVGLGKLSTIQQKMVAIEEDILPDCIVTTSGPAYWRSQAPHLMGFNLPLYLYPESPYLQDLSSARRAKLAAKRWLHCRYFRRDANALIVQTDDVNQRVRKLLGTEQVFTVTNNHNSWFDAPVDYPQRLPDRREDTFRLLTLTSYYPHKNLDIIPHIINVLPPDIRERVEFVLTLNEEEFKTQISQWIPPQIRLIGSVAPPECPSLYAECDAMFLPTLAECFSASYPEAMKMRKPIITSDLGFARSICEDAALYFEPCNAEAAAKQISRLAEDPGLQKDLRIRGERQLKIFDTPRQRAEKILAICQKMTE